MHEIALEPFFKNGWSTKEEASTMFGKGPLEDASSRIKELCRGMSDALSKDDPMFTPEMVMAINMSSVMARYQSKLHSFSGCTTTLAWGSATPTSKTLVTARNMDWAEAFNALPVFLKVFLPTEPGTFKVADFGWAGWIFMSTAFNEKGVYMDLHDGSSMGGDMVYVDRTCMANDTFDWMIECPNAVSMARRFNASKSSISLIYSVADPNVGFSFECPSFDNRLSKEHALPDVHVVVNTYLNQDWGIQKRETMSNSLRRYDNMKALAERKSADGMIDAEYTMECYDETLFNEDDSFKENGGCTKPTKQDADLTNYQMVNDIAAMKTYLKCPTRTEWREIDVGKLFAEG